MLSRKRIGQGEIRDRTTEDQHCRIASLNLLTAIAGTLVAYLSAALGAHIADRGPTCDLSAKPVDQRGTASLVFVSAVVNGTRTCLRSP